MIVRNMRCVSGNEEGRIAIGCDDEVGDWSSKAWTPGVVGGVEMLGTIEEMGVVGRAGFGGRAGLYGIVVVVVVVGGAAGFVRDEEELGRGGVAGRELSSSVRSSKDIDPGLDECGFIGDGDLPGFSGDMSC